MKATRVCFGVLLLMVVSFCLFFTVAKAQQDLPKSEETLETLTLEELLSVEIISASTSREKLQDAPASVLVITREQIRERGYQDISDVLKDLPGVDAIEQAGRFGEFYVIRGIDGNDRFLVQINGRKLNSVSGVFLSVGNSISVRLADRIEVIYGPASIIYGSDAFSGIINIITKEIAPNDEKRAMFDARYGAFNTIDAFGEAQLSFGEDFSVNAFARIFRSDGFRFNTLDTGYSIIKSYPTPLTPEFSQPINDHTIFIEARYKNFKVGYLRQQFDEGNSSSLIPAIYIYNEPARWKVSKDIAWLAYQTQLENGASIMADIAYIKHTQDPESQFFRFNVRGNPNGGRNSQYMTGWDATGKATVTYSQSFGNILNLVGGAQFEYTHSVPHYANDQVFGSPVKYEGVAADSINRALTVQEQKLGVFAQLSYMPAKFLTIVAGARFDYSKLFDETFNPRLAIIFKPGEQTVVKLMAGTAFQAPSLFYQYEQFGNPTAVMISSFEQGTRLANQRVTSVEAQITHQFGENIIIMVNPFYNIATGLIERVRFTDRAYNKYTNTFTSGLQNENIGSQTAIGAIAQATYTVSKDIDAQVTYVFTDAQKESATGGRVPLARVAAHKIWAGLTLRNLCGGILTFSPRARWVGEVNTPQETVVYRDTKKAPGYFLLNASLSIQNIIPKVRLVATAENILNTTNIVNVGLFSSGIYTDYIPQPGFVWRAGIEISL